MALVFDGRASGLIGPSKLLGLSLAPGTRSSRELPWWWPNLIAWQNEWEGHQKAAVHDPDHLPIPKDFRVFVDEDWVNDWYDKRQVKKRSEEAARARQDQEDRELADW